MFGAQILIVKLRIWSVVSLLKDLSFLRAKSFLGESQIWKNIMLSSHAECSYPFWGCRRSIAFQGQPSLTDQVKQTQRLISRHVRGQRISSLDTQGQGGWMRLIA